MSWPKAFAVWLLIVVAESILGAIRHFFLLDSPLAGLVGVLFGPVIVFAISWSRIRWINPRWFAEQLKVGLVWLVLTASFEFSWGMALSYPLERTLSFINLVQGGMGPGLLFVPFAPALAARARGFVPQPSITMRERLSIGVFLPVLIYALAAMVPSGAGAESRWWSTLGFLLITPIVGALNTWVLLIAWSKTYHCFLAAMYVPAVVIVFKVVCW